MATKKTAKKAAKKAAPRVMKPTTAGAPAVKTVPSSMLQAGQTAHMYLATDDGWSQRYWNQNDLHYGERVLFG